MTPRLNTTPAEKIKAHLLPTRSAIGAALRAPKNVPAERIETICEDCEAVMFK
jgi:hypothetical protein